VHLHRFDDEIPRHRVEERPDVDVDHPVVLPAPLPAGPDRVQRRASRPITIGIRVEDRLDLLLQMPGDNRLRDPVGDRGRPERSRSPRARARGRVRRTGRRRRWVGREGRTRARRARRRSPAAGHGRRRPTARPDLSGAPDRPGRAPDLRTSGPAQSESAPPPPSARPDTRRGRRPARALRASATLRRRTARGCRSRLLRRPRPARAPPDDDRPADHQRCGQHEHPGDDAQSDPEHGTWTAPRKVDPCGEQHQRDPR
jgi:hypothetical protein